MKSDPVLARIVPAISGDDRKCLCQGTKVMVGDQELKGVFRIELVAQTNDIWRARIDVHVQPPTELSALAVVHYPSRWQRVRRWWRELFRPAHGFDFPR